MSSFYPRLFGRLFRICYGKTERSLNKGLIESDIFCGDLKVIPTVLPISLTAIRLKRCRRKLLSAGQSKCPEEVKNCPLGKVLAIEQDERLKNFKRI